MGDAEQHGSRAGRVSNVDDDNDALASFYREAHRTARAQFPLQWCLAAFIYAIAEVLGRISVFLCRESPLSMQSGGAHATSVTDDKKQRQNLRQSSISADRLYEAEHWHRYLDGVVRPLLSVRYLQHFSRARSRARCEYSYAVLSRATARFVCGVIQKHCEMVNRDDSAESVAVLDVGAGKGYWTRAIQHYCNQHGVGVRVRALEPREVEESFVERDDIIIGSAHLLNRVSTKNDVLLMVWPSAWCSMAADAIKAFHGSLIVYVGEWRGGACADDAAFSLLEEQWNVRSSSGIPRWPGQYDRIVVFERQRQAK